MSQFPGHLPSAHRKTAAFPPEAPRAEQVGDSSGASRNIPKDHEFDSRALKPLSKALWASTVALGHALTAYRHFSRIKSATVSPDGLLGGRGYVMKLAEMRQKLYEASEALSSISDTIFDEISAPHWKPKLAQLDEDDKDDVRRFIDEAQEVMENPEGEAEEEIEAIEEAPLKSAKPKKKKGAPDDDDAKSSKVPDGGDAPAETSPTVPTTSKQASRRLDSDEYRFLFNLGGGHKRISSQLLEEIFVTANSSEPVGELPGGPRVDHLGPGTGTGEFGDFGPSDPPADDWNADGAGISRRDQSGEDFDYPSEWENEFPKAAAWKAPINLPSLDSLDRYPSSQGPDLTMDDYRAIGALTAKGWTDARILASPLGRRLRPSKQDINDARLMQQRSLLAAAGIPDASSDDTRTEGWDFGIGYGARGEGAGGYENPSGEGNGTKGVEGPHSGLPGAPAQSSGDTTSIVLDDKVNPRQAAYDALYGQGLLPQDVAGDVSRSDYYPGSKDNQVSVGTSAVPQAQPAVEVDAQPLPGTYLTEEDVRTPYVRFDYTTRNLRGPVLAAGEVK